MYVLTINIIVIIVIVVKVQINSQLIIDPDIEITSKQFKKLKTNKNHK